VFLAGIHGGKSGEKEGHRPLHRRTPPRNAQIAVCACPPRGRLVATVQWTPTKRATPETFSRSTHVSAVSDRPPARRGIPPQRPATPDAKARSPQTNLSNPILRIIQNPSSKPCFHLPPTDASTPGV
jgi:hypothetical protein